jgi:hypothetical protein
LLKFLSQLTQENSREIFLKRLILYSSCQKVLALSLTEVIPTEIFRLKFGQNPYCSIIAIKTKELAGILNY